MSDLLLLRGVHPLYAVFLMNHLGIADKNERLLAFESILELSRSLGKAIRVPSQEVLPPGPLATTRLDSQLLKLGLATAEELGAVKDDEEEDEQRGWIDDDQWVPILTLPYKLHRLFQYDFPDVHDVRVWPVWVAGEVLAVWRRLQQIHHQQQTAKAGGRGLSPFAANDFVARRDGGLLSARRDTRAMARRSGRNRRPTGSHLSQRRSPQHRSVAGRIAPKRSTGFITLNPNPNPNPNPTQLS